MDARRHDDHAVILLVDDDTRTAHRLARMLEEDGYLVEVFRDGADAVLRLERTPLPDVVVTDLMMPGTDGLTLMREARRRRPEMPVIFVTGYPERLARWGDDAGGQREPLVFTKPLEYAAFSAALGRLTAHCPGRAS